MKPAISVDNLSKRYTIGASQRGEYGTLRESLMRAVTAPLRKVRSICQHVASAWRSPAEPGGCGPDEIWALKDISFDVRPGEVLGVIGHNGAGKSTLLKILSRITPPSGGHADLYGRVGSLLEVGTGFHPELTGRENIYLNGAILGMPRREIARSSTISSRLPRSIASSILPLSAIPAACTCASRLPWRRTWSRRFWWSMKCSPWAMRRFRRSASAGWTR